MHTVPVDFLPMPALPSSLYVEDEKSDIVLLQFAWDKLEVANPLKTVKDGEEAIRREPKSTETETSIPSLDPGRNRWLLYRLGYTSPSATGTLDQKLSGTKPRDVYFVEGPAFSAASGIRESS